MKVLSIVGSHRKGELHTLALYSKYGNKVYIRNSYQSSEGFMEYALFHFKANNNLEFDTVIVGSDKDHNLLQKVNVRLERAMNFRVVNTNSSMYNKLKSLNGLFKEMFPELDGIISKHSGMNNAYKLYKIYNNSQIDEWVGA